MFTLWVAYPDVAQTIARVIVWIPLIILGLGVFGFTLTYTVCGIGWVISRAWGFLTRTWVGAVFLGWSAVFILSKLFA